MNKRGPSADFLGGAWERGGDPSCLSGILEFENGPGATATRTAFRQAYEIPHQAAQASWL